MTLALKSEYIRHGRKFVLTIEIVLRTFCVKKMQIVVQKWQQQF
jgi:hypothetical protein